MWRRKKEIEMHPHLGVSLESLLAAFDLNCHPTYPRTERKRDLLLSSAVNQVGNFYEEHYCHDGGGGCDEMNGFRKSDCRSPMNHLNFISTWLEMNIGQIESAAASSSSTGFPLLTAASHFSNCRSVTTAGMHQNPSSLALTHSLTQQQQQPPPHYSSPPASFLRHSDDKSAEAAEEEGS